MKRSVQRQDVLEDRRVTGSGVFEVDRPFDDREIVIFDVMPGQDEGDLARSLYALGLAMRTENGRVYPREELEDLLIGAGFTAPDFTPLDVPPYTMGMILAKKGGS